MAGGSSTDLMTYIRSLMLHMWVWSPLHLLSLMSSGDEGAAMRLEKVWGVIEERFG